MNDFLDPQLEQECSAVNEHLKPLLLTIEEPCFVVTKDPSQLLHITEVRIASSVHKPSAPRPEEPITVKNLQALFNRSLEKVPNEAKREALRKAWDIAIRPKLAMQTSQKASVKVPFHTSALSAFGMRTVIQVPVTTAFPRVACQVVASQCVNPNGWFSKLISFCQTGFSSMSPEMLQSGLMSAAGGFVLGVIDEILAPIERYSTLRKFLRIVLFAGSGVLTVAFIASTIISGTPAAVVIGGFLVHAVAGIVGGVLGKLATKLIRYIWRKIFPESPLLENPDSDNAVHADDNDNAVHVDDNDNAVNANNNDDDVVEDVSVQRDSSQPPEDIVKASDIDEPIGRVWGKKRNLLQLLGLEGPPHQCDPLLPGYRSSTCCVCQVKSANVGWIHGTVMHVCVCMECAAKPQMKEKCSVCPMDNSENSEIFVLVTLNGSPPLCAENRCLYLGTCRICAGEADWIDFSMKGKIDIYCHEHKPANTVARIIT